jgi:NAD(P)H-dependent FMN reductase
MPSLGVVIASVRAGRVGGPIAEWFADRARQHGRFDVSLIDLKEVNLPLFAEPNHPRLGKYDNDAQKAWSATVRAMDAFVFITPEYNFSTSPALLNALDYLYAEWNYKAAAIVSYGGVSGGLRAAQMLKSTLGAVKIVPIVEAVTIPSVTQAMNRETGAFTATESHNKAAGVVLDELHRWTPVLASLRG